MALRLYSEFHSSTDKLFKVEIHDENFTGTAEAFTVASDGFTLNYSGETDDIVSPIISSKATISAYNNSSAFDSFINALKQYQEKRFTVRIYGEADTIQDGLVFDYYDTELPPDNGLRLYWTGIIMQDLVTIEDTHKPYVFRITAVDGIGLLSNVDYTWEAFETIESFLERAVGAIGVDPLYASDDLLYATCLNTWDTNHTYNINTDVATLIRYYAPNYHSRDTYGNKTYSKYLSILQELCIAFGARFYQREGVYYFEQYIERTNTTRTVSAYYKSGTKAFTSKVSDDITLDGTTSGGARLAGNQFNFLPALKRVEVTHNKTLRQNLLGRFVNFFVTTPALSLGVLSDSNNAYLKIDGSLVYKLVAPSPGSNTDYFRPRFRIQLRVEDQANPGNYYYLKRDWSPNNGQLYGATSWSSSASYYYLDAGVVKNSSTGLTVATTFTVVTPDLPVEGETTIDIEQNGLYNIQNTSVSVPSGYFATWSVENVLVSYLSTQPNSVASIYKSSNSSTNINSNLVLDLGEVRTADAFGGPGSFFVYDGSAWVASSDWRRGNSGSYNGLLDLLTSEVLSLHSKPIERYSGTIVGPYPFGIRYSFDGDYWLPMQGTYNANMDEWSAEWFRVQKDDSNVAIDTPVEDGNAADFVGRVSSQQGTDEVIIATEVVTDQVSGSTVTVTGGTGTQGDLQWSTDEDTVTLQMNGTTHYIGQDVVYNVKNQTGSTITKGTAVMASGTVGSSGRILITPAVATGETPSRFYLGVTAEDIANGADGKVIEFGKIKQIDTSAYSAGDVLWLDPTNNGGFTTTEPSAPNWKIATGYVINVSATTGIIMVRANQGYRLEDMQDVQITSPADNDVLRYDSSTGVWRNRALT